MDIVIDIYTLFSIYLENSGYILLCIKTKKELQILKTIPVRPIYISHMMAPETRDRENKYIAIYINTYVCVRMHTYVCLSVYI